MGTFEEAARPGFEPIWRVEPQRAEVELLIEVVLVEVVDLEVLVLEIIPEVLVAEPRQHA